MTYPPLFGKRGKCDVETHLKRLGNLALIQAQKNAKAGNSSFEEKKKTFRQSSFLLTSQLAEAAIWDTKAIDNRQKIMAEFAVKTWSL
jgi:hypothetical protein